MLNSRFGYSMKKNTFKGPNIDCIQYSNIIRITYYSYSYSGTTLNRILFVFVFGQIFLHEYYSYSYSLILKKRILFVFVFGQNSDAEYYSYSYSVKKTVFAHLWFLIIRYWCSKLWFNICVKRRAMEWRGNKSEVQKLKSRGLIWL